MSFLSFLKRLLISFLYIATNVYFFAVEAIYSIVNLFTSRIYVTKPNDDLLLISAAQAASMIAQRSLTSTELVEAYIHRIEQINGIINAVVVKVYEEARKKARDIDNQIVDMDDEELKEFTADKPLLGVPFTMKDAFECEGKVITCGIYNRRETVCTRTADVVKKMQAAGGILLAITNVPEVCLWVESSNTVYGRSCNPYDSRRMTGGSSGGEGALIGAAGSIVGIGSDIGGSIRMPCFFNGIFGLKPTPGIVSLEGAVPAVSGYKTQMLRVGPMCRFAEDLPLLLKIMGGDRVEELRLEEPVSMKKLRVFYMEGIKENPFIQPLSREMRSALRRAVQYFERKYDLVSHRLDLPLARHSFEYFITGMNTKDCPSMSEYLLCTEGSKGSVNCYLELGKFFLGKSNHTLAGIVGGIIDGTDAIGEEATKELFYKRDRLIRELKELLGSDGIFLFPSWPCTALFHNQPLLSPINFSYTALFNALAFPVVQCPMGLDSKGLPLGVQVVGPPGSDRILIAAAKDLEEGFGGWVPAAPL